MSEVTGLVMPVLQQVQTRLTRMEVRIDLLVSDVQNVKLRLTHVEEEPAGVNRRLDRVEQRIERFERGLDPMEA